MTQKKTIITAGLPYANGDIHVGHLAGCYLPADIINRFFKLNGKNSKYICGTDDHGAAIVLSGIENHKSPSEIVSHFYNRQKKAFDGMNICFDVFGSTSQNPYHQELSNDFFLKIYNKGFLTKEVSQQFYDEKEKMFLPDRYVKGECSFCGAAEQNGDQCDNCGKLLDTSSLINPKNTIFDNPVVKKDTTHWYLDLVKCEATVKEWLKTAEMRDVSRSYVEGLLKQGLVKRSMTRDIDWGLPVPLDDPDAKGKVLYVWFDAPIGYISNTKQLLIEKGESEESYKDWWCSTDSSGGEIFHFIGEDNTIFHCIIWTAMLSIHGGYNLPTGVIINKFMNIKKDDQEEEKISKSKKNALWILDYLDQGNDPDYLRYYLTKIAPEKSRSNFSQNDFNLMCNADLADTLGNFISRSTAFLIKFIGDTIPEYDESLLDQVDREHLKNLQESFQILNEKLKEWSTKDSLEVIFSFARQCNKYFNEKAPWASRKTNMEQTKVTLAISMQSIYFLGCALRPFIPNKSDEILRIFECDLAKDWHEALNLPQSGVTIHKPAIIFPKILPPAV